MIELGKKYQTRDGRAVRILAMDMKGIFSVAGIITEMDGSQHIYSWKANGESDMNAANVAWNRNSDLIPVPTKHEGWCLVDIQAPSYATRAEAERAFHEGVYAVRSPASYRYQIKRTTWEDE